MKKLLRKIKNKKGFTLMEMLIVVAIMVILVAVSIPVFTSQLDNAKKATDDANLRSAKSLALTMYLTGTESFTNVMYYDTVNGKFVAAADKPADYGQSNAYKTMVISAQVAASGDTVEVKWVD